MGRIKPPSGLIFQKAMKPGMKYTEANKGKNWQINTKEITDLLALGEAAYTSPITRDVVGALGEAGAGIADLFSPVTPEAKSALAQAAAARTGAKTRGSVIAETPEQIAAKKAELQQKLQKQRADKAEFEKQYAATRLSEMDPALAQSIGDVTGRTKELDRLIGQQDIYEAQIQPPLQDLKGRKTVTTARDIGADEDTALRASKNIRAKQNQIVASILANPSLLGTDEKERLQEFVLDPSLKPVDTKDLILREVAIRAARETTMQQEAIALRKAAVPEPSGTLVAQGGETELEILNQSLSAQVQQGFLTPTEKEQTIARRTEQLKAQQLLPSDYVQPTSDAPVETPVPQEVVIPTEEAAVPPAAPVEHPAVPSDTVTKPLSKPQLQHTAKLIESQAGINAYEAYPMVAAMASDPSVQALMDLSPPEEQSELLANLYSLRSAMQAPAAAEYTPKVSNIDQYKITPGMSLGQAQAMAQGLAAAGGTQADLAAMMEDVENITGVSSVGGGFGRWAAGGRPGGYFMDPTAASQQLFKSYTAGQKAGRDVQSKALGDLYKQAQIHKIFGRTPPEQVKMAKTLGETEPVKAQTELRRAAAQKTRAQTISQQIKNKYDLPVTIYKKWLDASKVGLDISKALKKASRKKSKGTGISKAELRRYQSMLKSAGESTLNFNKGLVKSMDRNISSLDTALARAKKGEAIDVTGLTEEQIIELYGSDVRAYRKDLRSEALSEEEIKALEEQLAARKTQLATRKTNVTGINDEITEVQGKVYRVLADPKLNRKKKLEVLDSLNGQIEDLRNEQNAILNE